MWLPANEMEEYAVGRLPEVSVCDIDVDRLVLVVFLAGPPVCFGSNVTTRRPENW